MVDNMLYVLGYIRQLMTDWLTFDLNSLEVFYAENAKKVIVRATRTHGIEDMALQSVRISLCV